MRTYGAKYAARLGLRFSHLELALLNADSRRRRFVALVWGCKAKRETCIALAFSVGGICLGVGIASVNQYALVRHTVAFVWTLLVFPRGMFFIGCGFLMYTLYKLYLFSDERRLFAEAILAIFALVFSVRILAQVEPFGYAIYDDLPLFLIFVILIGRCAKIATPSLRNKFMNSLLAIEVIMLALILVPLNNSRTARLETTWVRSILHQRKRLWPVIS